MCTERYRTEPHMPFADDTRPNWLGPLKDARNEAILGAAFDIFQEKGLHGATMLEIATAAKVSKETLYARFDSKEGLFYALLAWGSEKMAFDLAALDECIDTDPVGALTTFAATTLEKIMQPESIEVHRIVVAEAKRMPEVARVFDEFTCQAATQMLDRVVNSLERQGLARVEDRAYFADAFIGLLRGNLHHAVLIGVASPPSPEEVAIHACRATEALLRIFAPDMRARAAA
jgi:TetR/AcrR family transcriptional regulator, mexJK operon transcriptional repressor